MVGNVRWSFVKVGKVDSTQRAAQKLASEGAQEGCVVVASTQSAGKGRKGRAWLSPQGGLYMSLILRPGRTEGIQLLPLVGAFAVADGIKKDTGIVPFVRWPNDVLIDGKKVAGIIAEAAYRGKTLSYVIVGIGINCNISAKSLGEHAHVSTSLMEQLGVRIDLSILRGKVLDCFAPFYAEWERSGKIVRKRKDWISTIGREVEITTGNKKVRCWAEDAREDGSLVVRVGKAKKVLRAEDVDMLREL